MVRSFQFQWHAEIGPLPVLEHFFNETAHAISKTLQTAILIRPGKF